MALNQWETGISPDAECETTESKLAALVAKDKNALVSAYFGRTRI